MNKSDKTQKVYLAFGNVSLLSKCLKHVIIRYNQFFFSDMIQKGFQKYDYVQILLLLPGYREDLKHSTTHDCH